MSRINTNVVSLTAQRNLAMANQQVERSLERLSTGLRINRGGDDPAGLIASERLRSEKVALNAAISNSERAVNLISTAEANLNEINGLLLDIQGLVDEAANAGGMTQDEIDANQLLIDEAIDSIDRIATTAQFNGKKLLDGSLGGWSTSGIDTDKVDSAEVGYADFVGDERDVVIDYGHAANIAEKATLVLDEGNDGAVSAAAGEVVFTGNLGSATLDFEAAGTYTASEMAAMINEVSDQTGVTARVSGADLYMESAEYGDEQFISASPGSGATFATEDGIGGAAASSDFGADTPVVSVDSATGQTNLTGVTVEGLTVTVNRPDLQMTIEMDETAATTAGAGESETFQIASGGGARFQIGPEVNSDNQVTVTIGNIASANLGTGSDTLDTLATGGANDLSSSDLSTAASIVAESITSVASLRGRLGAVQKNTLETQIRSLGSTLENITSAESAIRDTDFAEETANMTRAQILVQAGTSVLAMANNAPQNVLALLGM